MPQFNRNGRTVKNNYKGSGAPHGGHDIIQGYDVGSVWVDIVGDDVYVCVDNTEANAVWVQTDISGSSTFAGLTDVNLSSPTNGELLVLSGDNWINRTKAELLFPQAPDLVPSLCYNTDGSGWGNLNTNGASEGDVPTVQSDGTIAFEAQSGGSSGDTQTTVVNIGAWDMSSATGSASVILNTGISSDTTIRSITAYVRDDGDPMSGFHYFYDLFAGCGDGMASSGAYCALGSGLSGAMDLILTRYSGLWENGVGSYGFSDTMTVTNRGYVVIEHT